MWRTLLLLRMTRLTGVVDSHQLPEPEPMILRHRLNAPFVLGGVFGLSALGRPKHRIREFTFQGVVGVPDLEQLTADLGEAQRRITVIDRHERQRERSL